MAKISNTTKAKIIAVIVILFIFFLTIIIIAGRVLNQMNNIAKNTCQTDQHYKSAHSLTAWIVGLASVAGFLCILTVIILALINWSPEIMEAVGKGAMFM